MGDFFFQFQQQFVFLLQPDFVVFEFELFLLQFEFIVSPIVFKFFFLKFRFPFELRFFRYWLLQP